MDEFDKRIRQHLDDDIAKLDQLEQSIEVTKGFTLTGDDVKSLLDLIDAWKLIEGGCHGMAICRVTSSDAGLVLMQLNAALDRLKDAFEESRGDTILALKADAENSLQISDNPPLQDIYKLHKCMLRMEEFAKLGSMLEVDPIAEHITGLPDAVRARNQQLLDHVKNASGEHETELMRISQKCHDDSLTCKAEIQRLSGCNELDRLVLDADKIVKQVDDLVDQMRMVKYFEAVLDVDCLQARTRRIG